jgi:hypothetical protein
MRVRRGEWWGVIYVGNRGEGGRKEDFVMIMKG